MRMLSNVGRRFSREQVPRLSALCVYANAGSWSVYHCMNALFIASNARNKNETCQKSKTRQKGLVVMLAGGRKRSLTLEAYGTAG